MVVCKEYKHNGGVSKRVNNWVDKWTGRQLLLGHPTCAFNYPTCAFH